MVGTMSIYTLITSILLLTTMAAFVQRVSGFGFGIVFMSVLPMLMPSYGEATALSGSLAVVTALLPAISHRKHVNWKDLLPILLCFAVFSWFAVRIVTKVDSTLLRRILGVVMILTSLYYFFFDSRYRLRASRWLQVTMGSLSGLMGGLFAMQGPPAVVYFLASTDEKEVYMAQTQWYFLLGNALMTCYRGRVGFFTPIVGELWFVGVIGVLCGLWLGARFSRRISSAQLRKIVYVFLAIVGLTALLR